MTDHGTMRIGRVGLESAAPVLDAVTRLLDELGEEGEETGPLNIAAITRLWREAGEHFAVFAARAGDGTIVGVATVAEAFAMYANGPYGIINEMYVAPNHRGSGIGRALIAAAAAFGRGRGWSRLDVTAPESPRWHRTRAFYEREGFVFTGPKLKLLL